MGLGKWKWRHLPFLREGRILSAFSDLFPEELRGLIPSTERSEVGRWLLRGGSESGVDGLCEGGRIAGGTNRARDTRLEEFGWATDVGDDA